MLNRCLRWFLPVVVLASLPPAAPAAIEERGETSAPVSIARVRADQNGDFRPDRHGEQVTVRGMATVDSDALHDDKLHAFIQDDTGGIAVYSEQPGEPFFEGEWLLVTGTLSQYLGNTQLIDVQYEVFPADGDQVKPKRFIPGASDSEALEGQLVKVNGVLVEQGRNRGGDWGVVSSGIRGEERIQIFWQGGGKRDYPLSRFKLGARLEVVGVLGQYDLSEPYTENHTIWPRYNSDIRIVGFAPDFYKRSWFLATTLGVMAILLVIALRVQVRSRTRALRDAEEQLRTLFDGAVDAICVVESEEILNANQTLSRMLGHSINDLLEQNIIEVLAVEDAEQWNALFAGPFNDQSRSMETSLAHKNGRRISVEVKVSEIDIRRGRCYAVFIRDISVRKQAQVQLQEQKEQLAVTLASIGDGVVSVNIDGQIIFLNRVAERLTGWQADQAVGKHYRRIVHLVDRIQSQPVLDPLDQMLRTGRVVELSHDLDLLDSNMVHWPVSANIAPVRDSANRVIGGVFAFRDISDRKKREDELQNAAKLESIGVLAGGIAHDFNNILTSVIGNLSLASSLPAEAEEMPAVIEDAYRASRRARDLTQQLLTFAKGGAPIKKPVHIAPLIHESAGFALSGSSVRCNYLVNEDLYPVELDEGQFIQVINNLVLNAVEAMPEGGRLEIAADNLQVLDELTGKKFKVPLGEYVRITISDSGAGIPEESLKKIFDPYFTTKATGTGLGLAATYSIISNHEGLIYVDSMEGVGTTFTIYLPKSIADVKDDALLQDHIVEGQGRILVMDDEAPVRRVASGMLKRLKYEPDTVEDGEEAIRKYITAMDCGKRYVAVLMDLTIPGGMGGRETIQRLLEVDPEVVALVSSGYSNDLIMADFSQYGFSGVVKKPYDMTALGEALNKVLNSE